jgi:hypothetical protein
MIDSGYLRTLVVSLAIWLGLFLALTWTVDPYGVSPLKIELARVNILKPKRVNIDRIIKPYEVWRYQPRTVFLGSSRFQSIDPAGLDGTRFSPAYNAAIQGGGGLAESAAMLEEFFEFDRNLHFVFVELFFYHFLTPEPARTPRSTFQLVNDTAPLFVSASAIFDSLQTVFFNLSGRPAGYVAPAGHWIPPSNYKKRFDQEGTIAYYVSVHKTGLQTMTLEPEIFALLKRIIELCRRNSAELILVIAPTHPSGEYRLWSFEQWSVLEEWTRRLSAFENVFSFAQYNEVVAESTAGDLKYWNDPLHFNANLGQLMLRSFLGISDPVIPSNLLRAVTPETVQTLIHERWSGMKSWIDENPAYVAAFDQAKATTAQHIKGPVADSSR